MVIVSSPSTTLMEAYVTRRMRARLPWKSAVVYVRAGNLKHDAGLVLAIPETGYELWTSLAPQSLWRITELLEDAVRIARKMNPWPGMEWAQ